MSDRENFSAFPSTMKKNHTQTQNWKEVLPTGLSQQKPQPYPVRKPHRVPVVENASLPVKSAWEELKEQSIFAFESGLMPRSVDSRQKAVTIALMGKELGLSPMQSLCGIYVVNGMTALRGSLMLRLIYERIPGAEITVLTPPEKQNEECAIEMKRPNGRAHTFRYTVEDARKAGFMNKPIWQQHTSTMLRWAAIRTGARIVFADAIAGCYMEDEIPADAHASAVLSTETVEAPEVKPATASAAAPEPVQPSLGAGPDNYFAGSAVSVSRVGLSRPVTEKQVNRLYAIAHDKQWPRADVVKWMAKWFSKQDASELNRFEYDKICNFILEHPSGTVTE